ncbi:hypothetical protein DM01DRAFT_1220683 [Hesseltinella vesiculosa]|uniref:Uncharacterized protein n=1 Tax=Hesseltinella vesiculosa TaxID=101127 RepID=A0A1X2GNV3_9FUNG|nr:hypothetical protein DM01DRAFT_1220683 [Hesseltinella vesiculosa]
MNKGVIFTCRAYIFLMKKCIKSSLRTDLSISGWCSFFFFFFDGISQFVSRKNLDARSIATPLIFLFSLEIVSKLVYIWFIDSASYLTFF